MTCVFILNIFFNIAKNNKKQGGFIMRDEYDFATINGKDDILHEITELEKKISRKTGDEIVLIAYKNEESGLTNG